MGPFVIIGIRCFKFTRPIKRKTNLIKELDSRVSLDFNFSREDIILNSDNEQLSRAFFNILKNSYESIQEKRVNNIDFTGKIEISLSDDASHVNLLIVDNGLGFETFKDNIKDILNPYFTTKKKGTGLGLAIVNKTINEHNGSIDFISIENGAKIYIKFIK